MATYTEIDFDDSEFEDFLDELYPPVEICGYTFDAGYALRILDPIAFRGAMSDYQVFECDECGERHDNAYDAENCCDVADDESDEFWEAWGNDEEE